jgi:putative membrane protein
VNELESYRNREADLALAKKLTIGVWIVSIVVFLLVGIMRRVTIELPEGVSLGFLPPLHALLNSGAAIALVMAIVAIKGGHVVRHQRWIYLAMGCSLLFLLSYVTYHFTTPETVYGDTDGDGELQYSERVAAGKMRLVYLVILLSHIALAALSLPFILLTFVYGFTNQLAKHRKLAGKVFPVWLYVAVTGPTVYLLLRPYY